VTTIVVAMVIVHPLFGGLQEGVGICMGCQWWVIDVIREHSSFGK
jgi:hypothetical protein